MEKNDTHPETHVHGVEDIDTIKDSKVARDHQLEHTLTLRDVFRDHPKLGFDAQVNGAMISVESFRRHFGYVEDGKAILPADWQSAFNTISSVGQFFGGFMCSWIADRVGRRKALMMGLAVVTGGIFGEMFSTTNAAFVISKLILGFGLGFYLTLGPLATSEIAPVVLRGISSAGINLAIGIGQLLSNSVIKAFGERTDVWAYRAPFATQLFFCLWLLVFLPFVPETPWYLARKGDREGAKKSLLALYGNKVDVEAKLVTLEQTIALEEAAHSEQQAFVQCFKGTNRVRTLISMGVFVCQHFVGIIFVLGFSTYFFQLAGLKVSSSFDMGVGVTACGIVGNICSWFIINSFGRRKIFIIGMGLLTAILMLIGILDVVPTGAAKWVQSSLTVVYAFVYFASLGAMAFAILGETSSTSLRAPTIALATATQAVMGTAMNFAIPYMVNPDEGNLKGKVGFVFGGLGAIASIWAWFYVPELKGRTFDEIDTMFQNKVSPRAMGNYVLTTTGV